MGDPNRVCNLHVVVRLFSVSACTFMPSNITETDFEAHKLG